MLKHQMCAAVYHTDLLMQGVFTVHGSSICAGTCVSFPVYTHVSIFLCLNKQKLVDNIKHSL